MTSLDHNAYHVGIICPLKIELAAMRAMLDEEHGRPDDQDPRDHNVYFAGRIHKHNVVIACLPAGVDGSTAAATAANNMVRTFPQIRFGLLVGIGGGIPDLDRGIDIRLGDIVVSQPHGTQGGVVQYDKGKRKSGSIWERKGSLNAPPTFLLTALQSLQAEHELNDSLIPTYLSEMARSRSKKVSLGYAHPGIEKDVFDIEPDLLASDSRKRKRPLRNERSGTDPVIHYGTIASGNTVVKDAAFRSFIREECNALCVEMEAAGLMNEFPCLVIKGIADYANESKNDEWHRYAAATSAAFAKELLLHISTRQVTAEEKLQNVLDTIKSQSKDTVDFIRNQEERKLFQDCHQSLHTSTYEEYKELNREAVPGTCQWLFQHPKYLEWYRMTGDTLLWLSADPGCGKSVLSRYLIDKVLHSEYDQEIPPQIPHTVCYFFFKDNSNQDSLAVGLSAVLHQLFSQQPHLTRYAIPAFKTSGNQLCGEIGQLWNILQNAARDLNAKPITCIFDGLDECRVGDRKRLIDLLCRFYDTRARAFVSEKGGLKFFVTSRPYEDIQDAFGRIPSDLPSIRLRGEDENDQIHEEINLVIEDYMEDLSKELRLSSKNTDRIKRKLLNMENRTYLWLYLVIDHIRITFGRSLKPDREPINLLPRSVDEAYEQLLLRVEEDGDASQVRLILSIILGSRRALSISEMALALDISVDSSAISSLCHFTIDPDRLNENIRQWCGLFIFINHGYIYLLHQTTKEFLLRYSADVTTSSWRWKQSLPHLDVEKLMATVCIDYLHIKEFNDDILTSWMKSRNISANSLIGRNDRLRAFGNRHGRLSALKTLKLTEDFVQTAISFFEYASKYWSSHFRLTEQVINSATQKLATKLYDCGSTRFSRMNHFSAIREIEGDDYKSHAMLLAAFNGHHLALKNLLVKSSDNVNTRDRMYDRTPLIVAAEQGHCPAVQVLLDQGANVHADFGRGRTALSEASFKGHMDVVRLLLAAKSGSNYELTGPFIQALRQGHTSVARLLLDSGLDIQAKIDRWGLPLNPAEITKDGTLVARLRKAGVNLDGFDGWGTALHMAIWKGEEHLVRDLLERGADVNARCSRTGSVLRTACLTDNENIIDILWNIQKETSPATGLFHDTDAFLTALIYCNRCTVKKFIDTNTDINKVGYAGQTALQAACARGDERIVSILLDRGADINAQSRTFGTPLFAAAEKGHENIVRYLIAHGADLFVECGQRGTVLHAAAAKGEDQTVKLLLDNEFPVDWVNGRHHTALHVAAFHGHGRTVRLLLNEGADINSFREQEDSALCAAIHQGHADVVSILLDADADPSIAGPAFFIALCEGHIDIASLLLESEIEAAAVLSEFDRFALEEHHEMILKLARIAGRDDIEEAVWDVIDYSNIDDEYQISPTPSDSEDDPFRIGERADFINRDEWYEGYSREDFDGYGYYDYWASYGDPYAEQHGWDYDLPDSNYGRHGPETPSDIFSNISMPDDFVYDDLNKTSRNGDVDLLAGKASPSDTTEGSSLGENHCSSPNSVARARRLIERGSDSVHALERMTTDETIT